MPEKAQLPAMRIEVSDDTDIRNSYYMLCHDLSGLLHVAEKELANKTADLQQSGEDEKNKWPVLRREIANLEAEVAELKRRYELNLIMLQKS